MFSGRVQLPLRTVTYTHSLLKPPLNEYLQDGPLQALSPPKDVADYLVHLVFN